MTYRLLGRCNVHHVKSGLRSLHSSDHIMSCVSSSWLVHSYSDYIPKRLATVAVWVQLLRSEDGSYSDWGTLSEMKLCLIGNKPRAPPKMSPRAVPGPSPGSTCVCSDWKFVSDFQGTQTVSSLNKFKLSQWLQLRWPTAPPWSAQTLPPQEELSRSRGDPGSIHSTTYHYSQSK